MMFMYLEIRTNSKDRNEMDYESSKNSNWKFHDESCFFLSGALLAHF